MFGLSRLSAAGAVAAALGLATALAPAARADVIDDWNQTLLNAMRGAPQGPVELARADAIFYVAVYDTVNSFTRDHEPIITIQRPERGANRQAAIAGAAHRVLVRLYPDRKAEWDAALNATLANVPDGPGQAKGVAFGRRIANAVLAARANDHMSDTVTYRFGTHPGDYQLTEPETNPNVVGAAYSHVTPWVMTSGSQFRGVGPAGFKRMDRLLASPAYAAQLNEVKELGARNSATRTADQTELAWFWANDRRSTYRPPGHLLYITQVIANNQGLNVPQKARLFALVSIGMMDTGVAVWDMKFDTNIDLWRPVTAIRHADEDNNPLTTADPSWEPLLDFTPPFPSYPSGHASFGAVHAAVLQRFFGTDDITFTVGTDEPIVHTVTRTFHKLSDAARENGLSRVYLGVHYRFDADTSYSIGSTVGNLVFDRIARPLCAADMNGDGDVDAADMADFNTLYFEGNARADINKDGVVSYADFAQYVQAYLDGCRKLP